MMYDAGYGAVRNGHEIAGHIAELRDAQREILHDAALRVDRNVVTDDVLIFKEHQEPVHEIAHEVLRGERDADCR